MFVRQHHFFYRWSLELSATGYRIGENEACIVYDAFGRYGFAVNESRDIAKTPDHFQGCVVENFLTGFSNAWVDDITLLIDCEGQADFPVDSFGYRFFREFYRRLIDWISG